MFYRYCIYVQGTYFRMTSPSYDIFSMIIFYSLYSFKLILLNPILHSKTENLSGLLLLHSLEFNMMINGCLVVVF